MNNIDDLNKFIIKKFGTISQFLKHADIASSAFYYYRNKNKMTQTIIDKINNYIPEELRITGHQIIEENKFFRVFRNDPQNVVELKHYFRSKFDSRKELRELANVSDHTIYRYFSKRYLSDHNRTALEQHIPQHLRIATEHVPKQYALSDAELKARTATPGQVREYIAQNYDTINQFCIKNQIINTSMFNYLKLKRVTITTLKQIEVHLPKHLHLPCGINYRIKKNPKKPKVDPFEIKLQEEREKGLGWIEEAKQRNHKQHQEKLYWKN